jgi:phosphate acetyltransferase
MRNHTFDEIELGEPVTVERTLSGADVEMLSFAAGLADQLVLDDRGEPLPVESVQAVGAESLIAHVVNRRMPGPGSTVVEEHFEFAGKLSAGDAVRATVTPVAKDATTRRVTLECTVAAASGRPVLTGRVIAVAPSARIEQADTEPTEVILRRNDFFAGLIARAARGAPVATAVVHPCDRDSLLGPIEAFRRGLIAPVLVGPEARIRAVAQAEGVDLSALRIVAVEHSHAAADKAVEMARCGEVEALMKGSLHTDELMGAVVSREGGLRTARRISHVFLMDVPAYPRLLLVTDAAVNIAPDVLTKADIVQNAIDLAHVLGIEQPRVAVLAAVETVNPVMSATVDAAMLCKMADRGQITGGFIDGPLAFDNAVSEEAARIKKIVSPVAGKADILLVPDLEAGNMVAKQLQYLAGADSAGIVLGARVPIVLTSRADSVRTRLASTAVMKLLAEARRPPAAPAGGTAAAAAGSR